MVVILSLFWAIQPFLKQYGVLKLQFLRSSQEGRGMLKHKAVKSTITVPVILGRTGADEAPVLHVTVVEGPLYPISCPTRYDNSISYSEKINKVHLLFFLSCIFRS